MKASDQPTVLFPLLKPTSRQVSTSSSSSYSGDLFCIFSLCEVGFSSMGLLVLPHLSKEGRIPALSFRNSLPRERVREIASHFFVPTEVEIAIPRMCNDVLHLPSGFYSIYVDQLKAGLRIPLFPLLVDILDHYHLALTQLVPNVIRIVFYFQLFCEQKKVWGSISLFSWFFLLKSARSLGWYAFSSHRAS